MTDFATADYFSDQEIAQEPYEYLDYLREQNPVFQEPKYHVYAVTGYDETVAAFKDHESFSAANAIGGPFPPLPFEPKGDDISAQIEAHRHEFPIAYLMVVMDPPEHTRARSLLSRLLTPARLKENEAYMWELADRQLDEFIADGRCEFLGAYAKPFATLVIADLLGVPAEDRDEFRAKLAAIGGAVGSLEGEAVAVNPLQWLEDKFTAYISERRDRPREDILTELANATYPDGSTPEVSDVVHQATFLFAAGQETVVKLLGSSVRMLAERPDLQAQLRENPKLVGAFVEESLRMESPTKVDFRLARKTTTLGGVPIKAGSTLMLCLGAANRDPRKFKNPNEFRIDRRNVREHIAFGRGIHTCAGAPLARVEAQVTLSRLLARVADIAIDDIRHGPAGDRHYRYEPTFLLRGLSDLHITFTPAG
ncbi:MAG: cytochrome P450 [Mycobacterium sp.]|nr:cytochrome P450 [Mycobacterium sp.]MCB0938698.1 cytochrome P450 [Mycobacterium sp.]